MSQLDQADRPAAAYLLAVAAAGQFVSPAAPLLVGVGLSRFGLAAWLAVLIIPLAAGMFLLPDHALLAELHRSALVSKRLLPWPSA